VLAYFEDARELSREDMEHSQDRGDARLFFRTCLVFLGDPRSVGHRREVDVIDARGT